MPSSRLRPGARLTVLAGVAGLLPASLVAQSLPSYAAVNPAVTSRSGLYSQPYVAARGGSGWQFGVLLDYANAAELERRAGIDRYVLDGEYMRIDATVTRDITPKLFVLGSWSLNGSYSGFLDPTLNDIEDFLGLPVTARSKARPENQFEYFAALPNGRTITRDRSDLFLGDLRLGAGWRFSKNWQSVFSITLPTTTGPAGYGRGVPSFNVVTTAHAPLSSRFTYEGSGGLGVTPKHGGVLRPFQNAVFGSLSSGLKWRFSGQQAAFTNVFWQTSQYHDTGIRALDQEEVTLDLGFLLRIGKGPEWQLSLTEDLKTAGPAIDVSFRIGARW